MTTDGDNPHVGILLCTQKDHALVDTIPFLPLTKLTTPTGYGFDSPFFKGWVVRHTLSDVSLP